MERPPLRAEIAALTDKLRERDQLLLTFARSPWIIQLVSRAVHEQMNAVLHLGFELDRVFNRDPGRRSEAGPDTRLRVISSYERLRDSVRELSHVTSVRLKVE